MDEMQINEEEALESSFELEGMTETEARELSVITKRFLNAYKAKEDSDTEGKWLSKQLAEELPEKSGEEIEKLTGEILSSIQEFDQNIREVNAACDNGISKESWFADKVAEAAKGASIAEYGNYLESINTTMENANAQMLRTVTTKAGSISQCRNLDGFIAEQRAVNSFNVQARLNNSKYYAEVMVPEPGQTYGLNSFDTVIRDMETGKIVHQYQFKYGKDAKATIKLLQDGNYNNQRFVVPEGQVEEVRAAFPGKSVEAYMGGTDSVDIRSDTLTKEHAKDLQEDVQERGDLPQNSWNEYNTKEMALNLGKNAALAGVQSAAITTGFVLAEKAVKGEEIEADEVVEIALNTGMDAGVKAAAAGALEVAVQKEVITIIPPGTPGGVIAKIAAVGIEDAKILAKVAKNEITLSEGLDLMGRTTVAMYCGLTVGAIAMSITTAITTGATVAVTSGVLGALGAASASLAIVAFAWIPIVGPVVGGLVSGIIGYAAGSKYGNAICNGVKKICGAAKKVAKAAWSGIKSAGRKIASGVKSVGRAVKGLFRR